jgi:hypothetical protein
MTNIDEIRAIVARIKEMRAFLCIEGKTLVGIAYFQLGNYTKDCERLVQLIDEYDQHIGL